MTVLDLKTEGCSGNLLVKVEIAVCPLFYDTLQFQVGCEVLLGSPWVEKVLGKGIISVLFQTRYSSWTSLCLVCLSSIV